MVIYKYQYYANRNLDDFSPLFENNGDEEPYSSIFKRIVRDLKLNFGFVFTFGTAITAFFPMIENLVKNMQVSGADVNKETIVYLTICALAIAFQEPKEKYKKLFEELRLRGSYGFLKPLTEIFDGIKKLFNFVGRKVGAAAKTIADMFGYTALFVPFALTFADIVAQNNITLQSILEAFSNDAGGKLLSTVVGISTFTVKHLVIDLIDKLKSFKDRGIKKVKNIINKIRRINTDGLINDLEVVSPDGEDIKKFSDFEGEEIIQEND